MKTFITVQRALSTINFLNKKYKEEIEAVDIVVGMSRGGLVPAVHFSTKADKPLIVMYIDRSDNFYLDRIEWIKDKHVLFVDDVCRSGKTMKGAMKKIKEFGAKTVMSMTLYNVTSIEKKTTPDFSRDIIEDVEFPWDW